MEVLAEILEISVLCVIFIEIVVLLRHERRLEKHIINHEHQLEKHIINHEHQLEKHIKTHERKLEQLISRHEESLRNTNNVVTASINSLQNHLRKLEEHTKLSYENV